MGQSFNPKFYNEIAEQGFGKSFKYLVLFLLLVGLLIGGKFSFVIKTGLQQANQWISENLPGKMKEYLPQQIEIKNGKLSVDAEQPFIRLLAEEGAFIVDTTGKITSLDDYKNGLLITETKLIFKQTKPTGAVETKEQSFADVPLLNIKPGDNSRGEIIKLAWKSSPTEPEQFFVLTYELLDKWARTLWKIAFLPFFMFLFVYFLISKLLQLFLFSLVSLITNAIINAKLQYKNLLNIGIYALTPATFLATLFILFNVRIPAFGLIYILIYSTFLALGVVHVSRQRLQVAD